MRKAEETDKFYVGFYVFSAVRVTIGVLWGVTSVMW
jgi:hypothetical protein